MEIISLIYDPNAWVVFITLTLLEIVLGIDNIIVINILVGKLPIEKRPQARFIGLALAMITRVLLLIMLFFLASLVKPLFMIAGHSVSSRDLVLGIGGLFLLYKATAEIWELISSKQHEEELVSKKMGSAFMLVIIQIILVDIVFSLDSVITAIGIANQIPIMVITVIISIIIMMTCVNWIGRMIDQYPAIKIVALLFIVLVGIILVAESLHFYIDKYYIYSAMGFSVLVQYFVILQQKSEEKKTLKNSSLEEITKD